MIHFITKAKQTEKDLRTRFADDKFAEWEAQVIDALDVDGAPRGAHNGRI